MAVTADLEAITSPIEAQAESRRKKLARRTWDAAWPKFLAIAIVIFLAAELIANLPGKIGIGQRLNFAATRIDYIGVFEAMIVILLIGILVDSLVFGTADRAIRRRYGLIDAAAA